MPLTLTDIKSKYQTLSPKGKELFIKAFNKEFGYVTSASFRQKLNGRSEFVVVEANYIEDNIHLYENIKK
ncbi:hypothetical protein SAMN05421780_11428 [Flexibacter flexilis DSM 6793]|uniref:Uncharacterized protein n=1 Tax=Flexibacter flexilis DSM 6793 TaxID=927664 RepID=A0A1I1NDE0_9BACT|nr:hypothetical protein [Flexibacter flexilis]SFC95567.1 hypothetical protein SAMN05421780_11428 [Flexibacter flexilis DSM 6793]